MSFMCFRFIVSVLPFSCLSLSLSISLCVCLCVYVRVTVVVVSVPLPAYLSGWVGGFGAVNEYVLHD